MTRKEFLGLIGVTAGVTVVASCMSSCKKKSTNLNIDFTLDLSLPAYAVLLNNGGYTNYIYYMVQFSSAKI